MQAEPKEVSVDKAITADAERAAFEAFVLSQWAGANFNRRDALTRHDPRYGQYVDDVIQNAWVGWQGRAKLYSQYHHQAADAPIATCSRGLFETWIPVTERTPQCRHECTSTHQMVSDTVLVADSSNPQSLGLAHLQADGEWNVYDGEYDFMNPQSVTHWMPRPADPAKQDPVDPLYNEAVAAVVHSQRASVAFLQRFLGVGYSRAARIIEAMEHNRIVSGMNSDGARAVLMLEVPHA